MLESLKEESPTIWAEFVEGFQLEIRFKNREDIQAMLQSARTRMWDSKLNSVIETFDDDKYRSVLATEVIANWRGLTPEVLEKLVLLKKYPDEEVPFSVADAVWLLKKTKLDIWVQQLCGTVEAFHASKRAEATKN